MQSQVAQAILHQDKRIKIDEMKISVKNHQWIAFVNEFSMLTLLLLAFHLNCSFTLKADLRSAQNMQFSNH